MYYITKLIIVTLRGVLSLIKGLSFFGLAMLVGLLVLSISLAPVTCLIWASINLMNYWFGFTYFGVGFITSLKIGFIANILLAVLSKVFRPINDQKTLDIKLNKFFK